MIGAFLPGKQEDLLSILCAGRLMALRADVRSDQGGGSVCVYEFACWQGLYYSVVTLTPSLETVYWKGSEASGLLSLSGVLVLVISCATWLTKHGELVFQTRTWYARLQWKYLSWRLKLTPHIWNSVLMCVCCLVADNENAGSVLLKTTQTEWETAVFAV